MLKLLLFAGFLKFRKHFSNKLLKILVGGKAHTNENVNGLTLMMKCHFIHEQTKWGVQKHLNINLDKILSIPMQRTFEVITKNHSIIPSYGRNYIFDP